MMLPSVVKCAGVLASLALFGVAVATEGWKFVPVPLDEEPITFSRAWFSFANVVKQGDEPTLTWKEGAFVLSGALESEERRLRTLTLSATGKRLFLGRDQLDLEGAPEVDGYKVVKIEYKNDQVQPIHELCCGGRGPQFD